MDLQLEMPFGLDANDLNLMEYQRDFNEKLAQLLDQTVPELGYQDYVSRVSRMKRPHSSDDCEITWRAGPQVAHLVDPHTLDK